MFDFLSDEVFQIVVITALFVIGVILFMLYKRPSENIAQYLDDIDYRIDKMNKKLDDLTNTFVNGLMVDEDDTDMSSINENKEEEQKEEYNEEYKEEQKEEQKEENQVSHVSHVSHVNSLNYDGIEFSDIPNFSTDTSVVNDVTGVPDVHDVPEVNDVTVVPDVNDVTVVPDVIEVTDVPDVIEVTDVPEVNDIPEEINGKKKVNIIKRIIQSDE